MRNFICSLIALNGLLTQVWAINIVPLVRDSKLIVKVSEIPYPEKLVNELKSGFTNRLFVEIVVDSTSRVLVSKQYLLTVKYDLWEEVYKVQVGSLPEPIKQQRTYTQVQELLRDINSLLLPEVLEIKNVTSKSEPFYITIAMALNPIEKEKMQEVKKWVQENSGAATSGLSGLVSRPTAGKMFAELFSQVANGQNTAAMWKVHHRSNVFHWKELRETKE